MTASGTFNFFPFLFTYGRFFFRVCVTVRLANIFNYDHLLMLAVESTRALLQQQQQEKKIYKSLFSISFLRSDDDMFGVLVKVKDM